VEFDERQHVANAPDAEAQMLAASAGAGIRRCIEALPEQYRTVVVLREMEEMPYRDIAEAAGIPMGTVMSRLARARKRLEDCIKGALA
jgi:RNA polymerase sigma-70 factor (ECF subfamily)